MVCISVEFIGWSGKVGNIYDDEVKCVQIYRMEREREGEREREKESE